MPISFTRNAEELYKLSEILTDDEMKRVITGTSIMSRFIRAKAIS